MISIVRFFVIPFDLNRETATHGPTGVLFIQDNGGAVPSDMSESAMIEIPLVRLAAIIGLMKGSRNLT